MICNKYGSKDETMFKEEESIKILKFHLSNNREEYQMNIQPLKNG